MLSICNGFDKNVNVTVSVSSLKNTAFRLINADKNVSKSFMLKVDRLRWQICGKCGELVQILMKYSNVMKISEKEHSKKPS